MLKYIIDNFMDVYRVLVTYKNDVRLQSTHNLGRVKITVKTILSQFI